MTAATATTSASTRTRDVFPLALTREFEGTHMARPPSSAQRPASIKDAVIRWLNEEL